MVSVSRRVVWMSLLCLAWWVAGCTAVPSPVPVASPAPGLVVTLLYPGPTTEVEMGQGLRFIAQVADAGGQPVTDAQLTITVYDDAGGSAPLGTVETVSDDEGTYRGGPWAIPHRIAEGARRLSLVARRGGQVGETSGAFTVVYSTSDMLLHKYGFWLDAPALRGIVPMLAAERGDARNGLIRWGGAIPAQHVLPDNWVEIHWRQGRYDLASEDAARRFMLEEAGSLGFTPIRSIGPFERYRFKNWDAWKVGGRAQFQQNQVEWVLFYAPEVDKTYLIGTTVTLPPGGIDPHATLRESFEVHPEVQASGVAPEPLPDLLPGPELLEPPLGTRFYGTDQPIILEWRPVKELAADEYYRVAVDYNYKEGNPTVAFETRETQIALPVELYRSPNCSVFNWEVTLMRRASVGGRAADQPLSQTSLYWYVEWHYPPGVKPPFIWACPNAQS